MSISNKISIPNRTNFAALLLAIFIYYVTILLIHLFDHNQQILNIFAAKKISTAVISISIIYAILLILFFVKPQANIPIKNYFALNKTSWRQLLIWSSIIIIFEAISRSILHHLGISIYSWWIPRLHKSIYSYLKIVTLVLIIAPIFEELLFRGILFTGIASSKLGTPIAILLTAYLWTVPLASGNLYRTIFLMIFGILLGIARAKSRSTYVPIAMHIVNNLFDIMLLLTVLAH